MLFEKSSFQVAEIHIDVGMCMYITEIEKKPVTHMHTYVCTVYVAVHIGNSGYSLFLDTVRRAV